MSQEEMLTLDRDQLVRRFEGLSPAYDRLGEHLSLELGHLLENEDIPYDAITYRTKSAASFIEKIERKKYTRPFDEITDFCGIRIVCYYPSDIDRITSTVTKHLQVFETIDKSERLDPDRFGYLSTHFIVGLPAEWLTLPSFAGLGGLKAELQVRTILMHAWAAVEHELAYKKADHVPSPLRRKLFQLSAMFEIADRQFDEIRQERDLYRTSHDQAARGNLRSANDDFADVDSLQSFLNTHLRKRAMRPNETAALFDELRTAEITRADLEQALQSSAHVIEEFETDVDDLVTRKRSKLSRWGQAGVARAALDLISDKYWHTRENLVPRDRAEKTRRWRADLAGPGARQQAREAIGQNIDAQPLHDRMIPGV